MNVVIIDSDCKKYFPEEAGVKELLKDPECQVHYLNPMQLPQVDANCRCVLLSAMNSGLKKYHRDLIVSNPQVRSWMISIVGIPFKSEQNQLLDSISTALADSKVAYHILFDDAASLKDTAAVCAVPVSAQKTCLVVSGDISLAQKCAEALASYLPDWQVEHGGKEEESLYETADVILAVGSEREDFHLPAPKYGMGRLYAWIACSDQNASQRCSMVYDTLTEQGWSLSSVKNVYTSTLEMEEYARKLSIGELSAMALGGFEDFVIWDIYGLPLRSRDYNEETVCAFLERQCCFGQLTQQF